MSEIKKINVPNEDKANSIMKTTEEKQEKKKVEVKVKFVHLSIGVEAREQLGEIVLSFHHVRPRHQAQVIRCSSSTFVHRAISLAHSKILSTVCLFVSKYKNL